MLRWLPLIEHSRCIAAFTPLATLRHCHTDVDYFAFASPPPAPFAFAASPRHFSLRYLAIIDYAATIRFRQTLLIAIFTSFYFAMFSPLR
jgi:hypothetical protein